MPVTDECRLDLTVVVPWDTVKAFRDALIEGAKSESKIPGFRAGKAPNDVFAQYYEREILKAMTTDFAPNQVLTEVAKKDLAFAFGPEIRDMRLIEGKGLEIDASVEVFPRFELGEYLNIEVKVPQDLPVDDVADARIGALRHQQGSFANVDPRPAQDGDHVLVSIEIAMEDGEKVLELSDEVIDLDAADSLPSGFPEAIHGMSPGEETEFQYACSEDLFARKLAGKTLRCKIQLHQVGKFELPDVDDEFAQDVSDEFKTLDDLMERLRASVQAELDAQVEENVQQQVLEALAAAHPMPLPKTYLARRMADAKAAVERDMAREEAGKEVEIDRLAYLTRELDPELTDEQLDVIAASSAASTRSEQVLDRIAKLENISVSVEELDQRIRAMAQANKVRPDELTRHLVDTGRIHAVRTGLLREKVLAYVVSEANRIPVDAEAGPDDADEGAESASS